MNFWIITSYLLVFAGVGLCLISPILDRRSAGCGGGYVLVAFGLELIVIAMPWLLDQQPQGGANLLAEGIVAYGVVTFLLYQWVARVNLKGEVVNEGAHGGGACVPKLIVGSTTRFYPGKKTWRTYLYSRFSCVPTDGGMTQSASASGGAYFGLWYTTGRAAATPGIAIDCEKGADGKCIATGSETGIIEDTTGPTRVYVKNVVVNKDDTVTVVTKMGAALSASGGPSIAVTAGPVAITMSFPDASLSSVVAMGTYKWRCVCEDHSGSGTPSS